MAIVIVGHWRSVGCYACGCECCCSVRRSNILFIYLSIVFSYDLYVVYGFVCIRLCLDWPFLTMCLSGVVPQSGMVLCCFPFHSGVGLNTGLGCRVLCLVTPLGLCLPCWVVFLPL